MKVELTVDRTKELQEGVVPGLENELLKRLQNQSEDRNLDIRRAGSDGVSVFCREKEAKKKVKDILKQTWESSEHWFY